MRWTSLILLLFCHFCCCSTCQSFLVATTGIASKSGRSSCCLAASKDSAETSSRTATVIDVGVYEIAGQDFQRPSKVYQDASFVEWLSAPTDVEDLLICGVLDGHGTKGEVVSQFMADRIPSIIQQQLEDPYPVLELEDRLSTVLSEDRSEDPQEPQGHIQELSLIHI